MKNAIVITLALLALIFVFSCTIQDIYNNLQPDCTAEMENVENSRGAPEDVNRYDTEGYHSVDWWYWIQGICYTFTWGSVVGGCEVSTYTFEPIPEE